MNSKCLLVICFLWQTPALLFMVETAVVPDTQNTIETSITMMPLSENVTEIDSPTTTPMLIETLDGVAEKPVPHLETTVLSTPLPGYPTTASLDTPIPSTDPASPTGTVPSVIGLAGVTTARDNSLTTAENSSSPVTGNSQPPSQPKYISETTEIPMSAPSNDVLPSGEPRATTEKTDLPRTECPQATATNPVPPMKMFGDEKDCTKYYLCAYGRLFALDCLGQNDVFSPLVMTCVPKFSFYDVCTRKHAAEICATSNNALIGHPTACQRYYNCSDTSPRPPNSPFTNYESECPYPTVFDLVSESCTSVDVAYCGDERQPARDPCSYYTYSCQSESSVACVECLPVSGAQLQPFS